MQNVSLKLLLTIVDRGKGDAVAQLLRQEGVMIQFIALGAGTANKGLLALLGLIGFIRGAAVLAVRSDEASDEEDEDDEAYDEEAEDDEAYDEDDEAYDEDEDDEPVLRGRRR